MKNITIAVKIVRDISINNFSDYRHENTQWNSKKNLDTTKYHNEEWDNSSSLFQIIGTNKEGLNQKDNEDLGGHSRVFSLMNLSEEVGLMNIRMEERKQSQKKKHINTKIYLKFKILDKRKRWK